MINQDIDEKHLFFCKIEDYARYKIKELQSLLENYLKTGESVSPHACEPVFSSQQERSLSLNREQQEIFTECTIALMGLRNKGGFTLSVKNAARFRSYLWDTTTYEKIRHQGMFFVGVPAPAGAMLCLLELHSMILNGKMVDVCTT